MTPDFALFRHDTAHKFGIELRQTLRDLSILTTKRNGWLNAVEVTTVFLICIN